MKKVILYKKYIFSLAIICGALIILSRCGSIPVMSSNWPENQIKVDGFLPDWGGKIQKIPEGRISTGFKNDNQFLYICLASEDRGLIMTLLKDGLIIWLEPESGENNVFGIRYPMPSAQIKPRDVYEFTQGSMRRDDPEKLFITLLDQKNELQIIDKDRDPITVLPILNDEGIEVGLGYHSNQFVYELKIPLKAKKGFSYAADTSPGGKLRVRFESEVMLDEKKGGSELMGLTGSGQGNMEGRGGRRRVVAGGLMIETIHYAVDLKLDPAPVNK